MGAASPTVLAFLSLDSDASGSDICGRKTLWL